MNKAFKLKWNIGTQSWVVCSELTKTRGKSQRCIATIIALGTLLGSPQAMAAECPNNNGVVSTSATCEVTGADVTSTIGWQSYIYARDGGNITVTGQGLNLDLTADSRSAAFNSGGFSTHRNSTITGKNLSVTIKSVPDKNVTMQGLVAHGNSSITAETVNVDLTYINEIAADRGPKETYGIQVGTAVSGEDKVADGQSKVTVRDANIRITNTEGTTTKSNSRSGIPAPYQLTGIRVIRHEDKGGSTPTFESTGKVVINVYDSSNDSSGDYVNGIFVSGPNSKAILNDSEITIGKSGEHSAALKLGKARSIGTGNGIIESKGKMVLDTTAEAQAPTIRLVGSGSELLANFENSSSEIKSASVALLFGGSDYDFSGAGEGQKALFKNAVVTTTGTDNANLVQVNKDTKGELSLTGDKTNLTAATNSWLINLNDNSELNVTASHGKMIGLTNKAESSTLNIALNEGFNWILREHINETKQATFNKTNLASEATITAAKNGTANFVLNGDVSSDGGIITTVDGKAGDRLTIDGNYEGSNGALIKMDTLWNAPGDVDGGNSSSDVLHIKGTATGSTKISPIGASGESNIIEGSVKQLTNIINTIPVVQVDVAGERAFTGVSQTRDAIEVQLVKRTENGKDLYYWTMEAKDPDVTPPVTPPSVIAPVIPPVTQSITPPTKPKVLTYTPVVSGYVQMPNVNLEQGYATLRTLHERRGENQTLVWDNCGVCGEKTTGQSWVRLFGHQLDVQGKKRFGFDSKMYGIKAGHDFAVNRTDEGGYRLTGLYFAYNQANTRFSDQYRAVNGNAISTGKGKSKLFSLGLTHTRYAVNGSYLDLAGQLSHLQNQYKPRDNHPQAKQKGYGLVLSAEVGRPYSLTKHRDKEAGWLIEPQTQLIYQTIKLNQFNDGIRTVKQSAVHGLRGRVGVRLAYNSEAKEYRTNTFYLTANLWTDFTKKQNIKLHQTNLEGEKYSNLWGEIGLGVQLPIAKQTYLYSDVRYERQLNGKKREGYHGTVGLKYNWK